MIFISYCHAQSEAADQLEAYLKNQHIRIMRDKREMKKNDSISDFMSRISKADFAILLISDDYLRSYYCLHEALLAFQNRHMRNIIPVIFPDADCLAPGSGSEYIRHWYDQMWKLEHAVGGLPPQLAVEQLKKLRKVENYCINLGEFLEYIQDNNSICFGQGGGWLEETYRCLCERILSREIRRERVTVEQIVPHRYRRYSNDVLLAIDFGTSYTLAAVLDEGGYPRLIPDYTGNRLHHSTITFTDAGRYTVGGNSHNAIRNIKRLIGYRETVRVNGEETSLRLLIAMILKSIVRNAEEYLGCRIQNVLMALPVDFSLLEKKVLRDSAELAGITVMRFIPESSIETLLHSSAQEDESLAVFIDLGGGTLDITLSVIDDGISDVRYSNGDRHFGSIDLTDRLQQLLRDKLAAQYGIRAGDLTALAEQAKRELGARDSVSICYPHFTQEGNVDHLPVQITTSEFEAAARQLFQRFDYLIDDLKKRYEEEKHYLDHSGENYVFLTGQGTKLHMLRKRIQEAFPDAKIVDTYQENAVIRGLSLQNRILHGITTDMLLLNVFPSSLHMVCGKDTAFMDADCTIPYRQCTFLELSSQQRESGAPVSLEVYEKTVSKTRRTLFRTQFVPKDGMDYALEVEFDANCSGSLVFLEVSRDGEGPKLYSLDKHLPVGFKTDTYTILYKYIF